MVNYYIIMELYYIYCLHNENLPEYYIGHSKDLKERFRMHLKREKKSNSKLYVYTKQNGGINNFKMDILDEIYSTKKEVKILENYWIEYMCATLNTQKPTRTCKESKKNYKLMHPNKDKEYYEQNKEKINQKLKSKRFQCECGVNCRYSDRLRHFKSKFHKNYENA